MDNRLMIAAMLLAGNEANPDHDSRRDTAIRYALDAADALLAAAAPKASPAPMRLPLPKPGDEFEWDRFPFSVVSVTRDSQNHEAHVIRCKRSDIGTTSYFTAPAEWDGQIHPTGAWADRLAAEKVDPEADPQRILQNVERMVTHWRGLAVDRGNERDEAIRDRDEAIGHLRGIIRAYETQPKYVLSDAVIRAKEWMKLDPAPRPEFADAMPSDESLQAQEKPKEPES